MKGVPLTIKVFCIGFHKTGTSSLQRALAALGYRVTGPNGIRDKDIAENALQLAHRVVPYYDAFQDNPWPVLYREMDKAYPGSKFILTTRDSEEWFSSQLSHFGEKSTPMREWIYGKGFPSGNAEAYIERYERHNHEVCEYFRGRSEDLLVMDLAIGDGWRKLCNFLGHEVPSQPFPHTNSAGMRNTLLGRAKQLILQLR